MKARRVGAAGIGAWVVVRAGRWLRHRRRSLALTPKRVAAGAGVTFLRSRRDATLRRRAVLPTPRV